MLNIFRGRRPDVTSAQVAALVVAGLPAIATLLSAFDIADMSQTQQDSVADVLTWGVVLAGLLIGGDTTLRTARNVVDAKRDAAAMLAGSTGGQQPLAAAPDGSHDPEVDAAEQTALVDDDEEFAADDHAGSVNGHGEFDDPDRVAVEE